MEYHATALRLVTGLVAGLISIFMLSSCSGIPEAEPNIPEAEPKRVGVIPKKPIPYPKGVKRPQLSERELQVISNRIYFNEASSKPENLMIWNDNEHFVSLGIGHFIWYPNVPHKRFDETFPSLIDYLQQHNVRIPGWLLSARQRGAPWPNKQAFLQSQNDPEVRELKRILLNTKELQTLFFFDRIHQSIPAIVRQAPANKRQLMINNYNALAKSPGGWYPLIDYINFKGTGLKPTERYNEKGWGLSQALQEMRPVNAGPQALQEFAKATRYVLERRLDNAPRANNERRWLPGWKNRLRTYTQPL